MRKLFENLICKEIDTEVGIRYILSVFGMVLIILNPYLITDPLTKATNILVREADNAALDTKNPIDMMKEITDVSWLDLRQKSQIVDKLLNNVFQDKKKKITIIDHNQEFEIDTYFTTVKQVLNSMTIKLTKNQEKNIAMDAQVEDGMVIEIPYDIAERGYASWYGPGFDGRTTANGEIYDMYAMTAAHKSLPFDTNVRVINTNNGRSCIVRINDRGPYIKGRIIDLTYTAKEILGIDGIAKVNLEIVR